MYVTPQALIDEFGETELIELTDLSTPRFDAVDESVAQRACDRAIADVDSALSTRYTLPLSSVPALLGFLALDLARYYLYQADPPEVVKRRFDAAKSTLRALQDGKQSLGLDQAGAEVGDTPADLPQFTPGQKVFARGPW